MNFIWQNPEFFYWLWLLPILLLVGIYAFGARRRQLQRFATGCPNLTEIAAKKRRGWQLGAWLATTTLLIIALARPASDPQTEARPTRGRCVVFVLDVSRSMLATDLSPNRLERARLAILDCLAKIKGDRIALIAFAGNAKLLCPLTTDYAFFRQALATASPMSVERGGTLLGDALRKTLEMFARDDQAALNDVILITDGGDTEAGDESFALAAAQKLGEKNIRLIIVGIGDEHEGQRIPLVNANGKREFLMYQGREVWDKLNGDLLRQMARAVPQHVYLPVATGTFNLDEIYQDLIARADPNELGEKITLRYQENFQIFLATGLVILLLMPWLKNE